MGEAIAKALGDLARNGATVAVHDGKVHISYRCPTRSVPTVISAIAVLKQHKEEAVRALEVRGKADGLGGYRWPAESLEAERKFGHISARLYPFIGSRVRTPRGTGRLLQVFTERATVVLDGEARTSFFSPEDVLPAHVM
jgi:hypothetical protein